MFLVYNKYMREFILNLSDYLEIFLTNMGIFAPIFACIFIMLEAIVPILPLFVFISVNMLALGFFFGYIFSWAFTVLGSILVFYLIRKGFHNWFKRHIAGKKRLEKMTIFINKLKFTQIVLILSIPFAPSFFLNLAAGLTDITLKKYFFALIIGKAITVFFWGFIGTNLVESLQNPWVLIRIGIMLLIAYILSYFVNKWMNKKL